MNTATSFGKFHRLRWATLLLACASTVALAEATMTAGAWEFKMKVTAQEAKSGAKKNVSETGSTICLSPEFVAKEPFISPALDQAKMEGKGAKCSTSDYQRKDPNASWKMACDLADGGHVDMQVKSMVSPKKMTMDFLQHVVHEGEPGTVKVLTTATFVGECTSEMPVQ